jgi:glycosyltransferase involved in cell wall biosynthesis
MSIGCVLAQTAPDWELIAIDDGSTDDTAARLSAFSDPRIRVIRQENGGVSVARNRGLAEARGEYVAFLDADDTWEPTFLARMEATLAARPDAVLAYCGWQNLGLPGGRGAPFVPPDYEGPDKAARLIEGCRWPIHAALTRRACIQAAGGFDRRLVIGEDFLLWMTVAIPRPILRVPEVLAYYHFHGGVQATGNRLRFARQTLAAQRIFLGEHPGVASALGNARIREITLAPLLRRAYEAYWARDLQTARALFIDVMKSGYGTLGDWKYMLPSLLPLALHRALIRQSDDRSSP